VSNSLLFLALAAATGFLFGRRWYTSRRTSRDRRRLEYALKHLFEEEYRGRRASLSSLGGTLGLRGSALLALVARMQAQGLIAPHGQEFGLTTEGERLALQVVRAHRLLERYFADEARLPIGKVHRAAERREHALTPAAADRLSAALGHPTHDPHGDPIPTRDGLVAPPAGTPATSWPAHELGRVVHLEDEPEISFAQIVAEGLRVGQHVRVLESTADRVVMTDGEHEFRLAPAVAANVFLAAAERPGWPERVVRLADLPDDRVAEVVTLDEACQGFSRRRLMDLGFTEGARIRPALRTFSGDPRAYDVRGTTIALRRDQASQVLVRPIDTPVQAGPVADSGGPDRPSYAAGA
jgi:DtxR family transcriptional regulator, Mn-dependent transcriptional regulator